MNTEHFKATAPVDPLIRDKEAAAMLRISTATFWRRVKDGALPRPIKFGGMSRWSQSEIAGTIERLKATRGVAA